MMENLPATENNSSTSSYDPNFRRYFDTAFKHLLEVVEIAKRTKADPKVLEGLAKVLEYTDLCDNYTLRCTSQESGACRQVVETTLNTEWEQHCKQGRTRTDLTPDMLSGRLEGQLLKSLISAQRARRVLDVGMYTGYSALNMAEALPADGELVTLDVEPFLKDLNQPVFDAAPQGKKITIRLGTALGSMRQLVKEGKKFDFIFLDAVKSEYVDYIKICFEEGLLAENGTVAVDNAYLFGTSYLPCDKPDPARLFGGYVVKDKSLHKVLVPVRDGVMLIRRLSEVEPDLSH